ncbi:division/cell wall cluster transcriptional repressor MraZ [Catenovulum sp. SM1970]|uniref:division/cell wall cluster transcriptional repressor MraZ n=1 Tax=Marinifaba aquimaris TaxID=2741323 RepID=UPI0015744268|nr:division/cell wall cluster transcriptional repressor MraZ [Marinifaba aquimaris]
MLRGTNNITMDDKGRIAIPARYRELLHEECNGAVVCTIDPRQPDCLMLYPLSEWEVIESELKKQSNTKQVLAFKRVLLGFAVEGEIDKKNGRFVLPPVLREKVGLEKQLMLVGQLNKFEIWDQSVWQSQMDADIEAIQADASELMDFNF